MKQTNKAITVENISKIYRIGLKEKIHDSMGSAILNFLKSPINNYKKFRSLYKFNEIETTLSKHNNSSNDLIWALKDISFELDEGDILGIIGRNGAGKSTLLKILAKITDPTSGQATIRGRVSSLLEVGTGFHPELTGRENVYLNGTILGMKKREIDLKFDDIVAFSEIEKFIDTPVKRYSSGMRVRLAFSVAAHLEPEILIIDEVLAVGDSAFQKKCLDKMDGVAKSGRTVLFVSHNMGMVSELCSKCMLLSHGQVAKIGDTRNIVAKYLSDFSTSNFIDLQNWTQNRDGKGPMRIANLSTLDQKGRTKSRFTFGEPITIKIGIKGTPGAECVIGLSIRDVFGHLVLHFSNLDDKYDLILPSADSEVLMRLDLNVLNAGTYYLTVFLGDGFNLMNDKVHNCLSIEIETASKGRVVCKSAIHLPAIWDLRGISESGPNVIDLASKSA
jgi:lipopolysaccharide transport system ATP-binding protein